MPKIIKLTVLNCTYIQSKKMPNTKSAIRRVRRVKKQTQVNRIRKSKYKNAVKQMEIFLKDLKTKKKQKNISQNFNQF